MTIPRLEGHHVTAKYLGQHLDSALVLSLGSPCHIGTHQVRATVDLDRAVDRAGPLDRLDLVELRLRRTAADLTWLALPPDDLCVSGCLRHDMDPAAVRAFLGGLGIALDSWADDLVCAQQVMP